MGRRSQPAEPGLGELVGVVRLLAALAVVGTLLFLFAPTLAERAVFLPSSRDPGPPPTLSGATGQDLELLAADGVRLHAWWYEAEPGAPAVLLLHGNAGTIGDRLPLALGYLERGISILLLEYRGYGRSEGRPDEAGVLLDALAGWKAAVERAGAPARVVLHGRSLGGAVGAVFLARQQTGADRRADIPSGSAGGAPAVAGLILESTFTSLEGIAKAAYPFLPSILLVRLRGRFDAGAAVADLDLPLLVVHGSADQLVPVEMGRELHEAAGGPSEWFEIPGAGHNDPFLVGGGLYFDRIAGFVRQVTADNRGASPATDLLP